jgi:hypothetical protein
MTQRDESDVSADLIQRFVDGGWILQDGTFCRLALSDRPGDVLNITVDRERRRLVISDVNGAHLASISCPAVMAGARPEALQ